MTHRRMDGFCLNRQPARSSSALAVSIVGQAMLVALVGIGLHRTAASHDSRLLQPIASLATIPWLADPRPGGGGGGGNQTPEPPRRAERPGTDARSVPVALQPRADANPVTPEPAVIETLDIPAIPLADATASIAGTIVAPAVPPTTSLGSGRNGGSGSGQNGGDGPGDGPGVGPGSGRGAGGGPGGGGTDMTQPTIIRQVKPLYTTAAMQAQIQGVVVLQAIVERDGTVSDVRVLRSLDPRFGLDEEAIKAARQWRFRPSVHRLTGEPVAAAVTIELAFSLR